MEDAIWDQMTPTGNFSSRKDLCLSSNISVSLNQDLTVNVLQFLKVFKLTLLCETILFLECYKKSNPNLKTWIKLEICWKLLKCMKNFTHIALCKMYLNIRFWHTIPSFMQDLHTISCCVNFWRLKMRHFSPTQEIEPIISHQVFKF